jgi:hypothetical protein
VKTLREIEVGAIARESGEYWQQKTRERQRERERRRKAGEPEPPIQRESAKCRIVAHRANCTKFEKRQRWLVCTELRTWKALRKRRNRRGR